MNKMKNLFNAPNDIIFCNKCVMSNQRPASIPEYNHTFERKGAKYLNIDSNGVCDACHSADEKLKIDWEKREKALMNLLEKYRSNNDQYDCLVPGSGGKDSAYQAHILKTKYGMNPLTCTWPPILYTDYGYKNFLNWLDIGGFDNITWRPNGSVMKTLTRLSIQNLLHPFQTFIIGQKNMAPKLAAKFGINLVFYGENEAEYGNPIADNVTSLRDNSFHTFNKIEELYLAGVKIKDLINEYNISYKDLMIFLPIKKDELIKKNIEIHYLGYYLKWTPQEVFYYATEHTGFRSRPFRSQGTYSKYNSIDDKIDDLQFYTLFIKYGIGRATYDASQEIRNKHITRDEGKALVNRFDGEFPDKYFNDIMDHIEMKPEEFFNVCDKFRSPHLWEKNKNSWELRSSVYREDE